MHRQHMTEEERRHLDRRVAETEQRTGAQIVLAVTGRSDAYPELPWKAFALGASAAGFAVVLLDLARASWTSPALVLLTLSVTLLTGAGAALLCVAVPGFARLFLDRERAELEARQYAESLFLSREIFATSGRRGILLLVSLFERTVIVLPDAGLTGRLDQDAMQRIIGAMTACLAEHRTAAAFEAGLAVLEASLSAFAPEGPAGNELPDGIVEEQGP